jgi:hypothetical protein
MRKKILYAVEKGRVQPDWKMRNHAWLDTKTMKPKYSVQARDPESENWAHVYDGETKEIYFFESPESASGFIGQLQKGTKP